MLSARQLLVATALAIAAVACVDRITYVDRPVPTPGPLRVDTVVVQRPETTFVQLPGRVDTVVTRTPPETSFVQLPPRVDTVIKVLPETLVVTVHDTVIRRDTVIHYDTVVLLKREWFCVYREGGDSVLIQPSPGCQRDTLQGLPIFRTRRVIAIAGDTLPVGRSVRLQLLYLTETVRQKYRAPTTPLILPNWSATH